MAMRFETTVADLPGQVARLGVSGTRRVVVSVLDEAESEKFTELKRLIAEGMEGEALPADRAFAEIRDRIFD